MRNSSTAFDRRKTGNYAAGVATTPTPIKRPAKPSDDVIRDAILIACEQRAMSRYDLAKLMQTHGVAPMVTYQFLRKPDAQLRSGTASLFFLALGLEVKNSANKSQ